MSKKIKKAKTKMLHWYPINGGYNQLHNFYLQYMAKFGETTKEEVYSDYVIYIGLDKA